MNFGEDKNSSLFSSYDDYTANPINYSYYEDPDESIFSSDCIKAANAYDYVSIPKAESSAQSISKKVQHEDDTKSLFDRQNFHAEDKQADRIVPPKKLTKQQIADLRNYAHKVSSEGFALEPYYSG